MPAINRETTGGLKALTLWQPWASLIAMGLKQYETRDWPPPATSIGGLLAIHAAARPIDESGERVWLDALSLAYQEGKLTDKSTVPLLHQLPLGKVVAIAKLEGCHRMKHGGPVESFSTRICDKSELELMVGLWQPGRWAWELSNVRPLLEPVQHIGRQRVWTISDHAILTKIAGRVG